VGAKNHQLIAIPSGQADARAKSAELCLPVFGALRIAGTMFHRRLPTPIHLTDFCAN
jgi:hypothetical protein